MTLPEIPFLDLRAVNARYADALKAAAARVIDSGWYVPVSYTHLTLPTICSV